MKTTSVQEALIEKKGISRKIAELNQSIDYIEISNKTDINNLLQQIETNTAKYKKIQELIHISNVNEKIEFEGVTISVITAIKNREFIIQTIEEFKKIKQNLQSKFSNLEYYARQAGASNTEIAEQKKTAVENMKFVDEKISEHIASATKIQAIIEKTNWTREITY